MSEQKLLQPKLVEIRCQDESIKKYYIGKYPAIAGREIIAKYPLSALPKLGDYGVNEETMLKLMQHVAVPTPNGGMQLLLTAELVNNHIPDWEALARVEAASLEYNCSFFTTSGAIPGFIDLLLEKAAPFVSKILTSSLQVLSKADVQIGSSSETK